MRLKPEQVQDIVQGFNKHIEVPFKLYLIGSRTKDHARGGDIDLLLIANEADIPNIKKLKPILANEIMKKKSIDDTRVDIVIGTEDDLKDDPFISTVNETKIQIF